MLFKHVLVSSMSFLINMWFGNHRSSSSLFFLCSSYVGPSLLHRWSIASPSKRWTIDGVTMEYRWSIFGERAMSISRFFSLNKYSLEKRKRPDHCRYAQKSDLRHILFMPVGSLFAIFCLLFGRTRTVSSGYVFLFLCLGLDLSVILLWLGASAGE